MVLYASKTEDGFLLSITPSHLCLFDSMGQEVLRLALLDIDRVLGKNGISSSNILTVETTERKYTFSFEQIVVVQTMKRLIRYHKDKQVSPALSRSLSSSTWIIPFSDLQFVELVGQGSSGKIWRGKLQGQRVAIKQLSTFPLDEDKTVFRKELDCLISLRHPSCIRFYGVAFDDNDIPNLVMEYCENGSLEDMINSKDKRLLNWTFLLTLLLDISRGMRYIHSCGIIHRDIKPANIMISTWNHYKERDHSTVRIVDYGISRSLKQGTSFENAKTFCGSTGYIAPEVYSDEYQFSSDVFGYGVLAYLLIYKKHPFPIDSQWEYEKCMTEKKPIQLPSRIPAVMEKLLLSMLSYEPSDRPEFTEISKSLKFCLDRITAKEL